MITIKDIAAKCGVSIATVSKALNGQTDISEATRLKVKAAASELGYLPNAQAKALKNNKTNIIGILMDDRSGNGLGHSYFATVIECFREVVSAEGFDIMVFGRHNNDSMSYYDRCKYRNVEGVMIACADYYDSEIISLMHSNIPVVSIDYFSKRDYSVFSDSRQGIRDVVEYVYGLGHRKIACVYGDTSQVTTIRLDTFVQTMKQLGLTVEEDYVKQGRYGDVILAKKIASQMIELYDPPTCIIMPDDTTAYGVFLAASDHGLKVPDDISVVGYDGLRFGQLLYPNLVTVKQNAELVGKSAAELLIKRINGESVSEMHRQIVIETMLIKGQSVSELTV
ncbi:MAG: LacI family DNA-binding transcriptional regulator [Oscillospiraceae bacterium]|nr:LacI family DNA-binding transcriptional regulator [Oscillospiraceae bacterium]